MPNSIKQIGSHAFSACFKYDSVLIPKNIERIDISAFFNTKIISIYVDSDNKFYDSRDNCNAIIETCSNKLITGCVNTVIPKSVRIVDISGFANYELKQIKIPETVEKIEMTFEGLGFLEKIFVPANKKAYFMSQLSSYFWDALDVY